MVGVLPKSSAPKPLSSNRFPETAASSKVVNSSSSASGVEITVTVAVAVLVIPLLSVSV